MLALFANAVARKTDYAVFPLFTLKRTWSGKARSKEDLSKMNKINFLSSTIKKLNLYSKLVSYFDLSFTVT